MIQRTNLLDTQEKKETANELNKLSKQGLGFFFANMSQDDYIAASRLSLDDKENLINKLIRELSHNEILQVIHNLMRHEISCETEDPIRTGNRLIGILLSLFVKNKDGEKFKFYFNSKGLNKVHEFIPNENVIDAFKIVKAMLMEKNVKTKNIAIFPLTQYQLLITATPEEIAESLASNKTPNAGGVNLVAHLTKKIKKLEKFNEAFELEHKAKIEIPKSRYQIKDTKFTEMLLGEIKNDIVQRSKANKWDIGYNFCFFTIGGTHITINNRRHRVPHRVAEIYKTIEKYNLASENEEKQQAAKDTFKVLQSVQDALSNPRSGRRQSTTEFYESINNQLTPEANHPEALFTPGIL